MDYVAIDGVVFRRDILEAKRIELHYDQSPYIKHKDLRALIFKGISSLTQ
jgi:hypothetical protein